VKLALSVSYRVGTWRQFEPAKYTVDQPKLTRAWSYRIKGMEAYRRASLGGQSHLSEESVDDGLQLLHYEGPLGAISLPI
jgi:hypothetical protein